MSKRSGSQFPCSGDCGRKTRSASGKCHWCLNPSPAVTRSCLLCGAMTPRPDRHCFFCHVELRRAKEYKPKDIDGLGEGEWVFDPQRRVKVWRPAESVPETPTTITPTDVKRRTTEDERYDDTEAARAHQAYKRGDRGGWATVGHRVYCRRIARKRAQREDAA